MIQKNSVSTIDAKPGCLSILMGGIVACTLDLSSISLKARKRAVTIHAANNQGVRHEGASLTIEQVSKDFLLGSSIAYTFIGNKTFLSDLRNRALFLFQDRFLERFNAAVFEDEIQWYTTEPKRGQLKYTLTDQL
ncbi:hypothetical protein BC332_15334 [Capsicum chinense]|nr:hypothetical protein BC332_15334 [Capsicum chinense]